MQNNINSKSFKLLLKFKLEKILCIVLEPIVF